MPDKIQSQAATVQNCATKFYRPEYLRAVYAVSVQRKEQKAIELVKRFTAAKAAVALSGKDSLVSLHLALRSGINAAAINRYAGMRRLPDGVVDELVHIARNLGARVEIISEPWDAAHDSVFRIIATRYGYSVIITGLRRRENGSHMPVETHLWGVTINPVVDWTAAEVWAYVHHHGLPVPSAYCAARHAFPDNSLQRLAFLEDEKFKNPHVFRKHAGQVH